MTLRNIDSDKRVMDTAVDSDLAAVGLVEAGQQQDNRRLPNTGLIDEGDELAAVEWDSKEDVDPEKCIQYGPPPSTAPNCDIPTGRPYGVW